MEWRRSGSSSEVKTLGPLCVSVVKCSMVKRSVGES